MQQLAGRGRGTQRGVMAASMRGAVPSRQVTTGFSLQLEYPQLSQQRRQHTSKHKRAATILQGGQYYSRKIRGHSKHAKGTDHFNSRSKLRPQAQGTSTHFNSGTSTRLQVEQMYHRCRRGVFKQQLGQGQGQVRATLGLVRARLSYIKQSHV